SNRLLGRWCCRPSAEPRSDSERCKARVNIRPMRQVVLDTETTGSEAKEGHRCIEVAAIEIVGRRITERRFHQYVNPERDSDDGALAVHGLNKHFLADKPKFNDIPG